jgi:hypothetical protein
MNSTKDDARMRKKQKSNKRTVKKKINEKKFLKYNMIS